MGFVLIRAFERLDSHVVKHNDILLLHIALRITYLAESNLDFKLATTIYSNTLHLWLVSKTQ